jgi:hypothetical protein
LIQAVEPEIVFVHHFDKWRKPYSEGIPEANLRRAQRFARDVSAVDKQTNVIVPEVFEPYTFE